MKTRGSQSGLSLVELMVGTALGLLLVAAAIRLLAAQWQEHRAATTELKLMQELDAAADLVARDLRRAGHWSDAAAGMAAAAASAPANPYAAMAPSAAASDAASFSYSRDTVENHRLDGNEQFGFRLRSGVIELQLGLGNWQALTDPATLRVTAFEIVPQLRRLSLLEHCPVECPGAAAAADAAVERTSSRTVHVRNDAVSGHCPPRGGMP